jgi:hypothetical protein
MLLCPSGSNAASRSISVNWSLAPLNNPDRLQAMRAAYLTVLDPMAVDDAENQNLQAIIGKDSSYAIEPGWEYAGRKRDVPKHPAWVAHCGRAYVWVMPENTQQLGRFRLLLLNIATYSPASATASAGAGGTKPEATHGLDFVQIAHSSPLLPNRVPLYVGQKAVQVIVRATTGRTRPSVRIRTGARRGISSRTCTELGRDERPGDASRSHASPALPPLRDQAR